MYRTAGLQNIYVHVLSQRKIATWEIRVQSPVQASLFSACLLICFVNVVFLKENFVHVIRIEIKIIIKFENYSLKMFIRKT